MFCFVFNQEKTYRKGLNVYKDHLVINKMILSHGKKHRTNLCVVLIDFSLETFQMFAIPVDINNLQGHSMSHFKTVFY